MARSPYSPNLHETTIKSWKELVEAESSFEGKDEWAFRELTPSDWTNMIESWTGSPTREGQKGSCHEKAEGVQFRIQASSY